MGGDPKETPSERLRRGHGETILVVDDADRLRSLMVAMLEAFGYRVLEARTPREALALLRRHRGEVSLLLVDVILPEMSGRDLAVVAQREHGVRRVLYVSGYTPSFAAEQGHLEAGTHILQKPFREAELLRAIRHVLDESS